MECNRILVCTRERTTPSVFCSPTCIRVSKAKSNGNRSGAKLPRAVPTAGRTWPREMQDSRKSRQHGRQQICRQHERAYSPPFGCVQGSLTNGLLHAACIALSADEVGTPRAQCADSLLPHFSGSPCPSPGLPQSVSPCPSKSNSFAINEAQRLAMLVSPRASLVGLKPAPAGPLFELAEQLAATFAKERAMLQISMPGK
ncbi:hypothetical protein HaLaN_27841 [Haematococcus lacustris]|uniref:Uncharacterized protein n=1 Tax=Haematococcus lacustris TaxID=44745 RepID=A0A6A0A912_HAELA|nr:hypothetical protein HaLaN_27841 [Haematococcus lacustris]